MPDTLTAASLSNKRNRQRSIEPNVGSYKEFLDFLYDDLEFVITRLTHHRDKYAAGMKTNPKEGEDLINTNIVDMLTCRGWTATHDTHVNGHADIVVKVSYEDYLWIGESKINQGGSYIHKGFKQLLHRYATGLPDESAGGVLIYMTQTKKTQTQVMEDWKQILLGSDIPPEEGITPLTKEQCNVLPDDQYKIVPLTKIEVCPKNALCFHTTHLHPQSGLNYIVRHMAIDFRYDPQDQAKKADKSSEENTDGKQTSKKRKKKQEN